MALSPITTSTVEQLKDQLATYQDIIFMMNNGSSQMDIAAKYGFYPDSIKSATNNINIIKAELMNRGEFVENLEPVRLNTKKKTIIVISIVGIIIVMMLIGKYKALKS